jgi:uncharacterized membrane protein HdeD (DUF308 family)
MAAATDTPHRHLIPSQHLARNWWAVLVRGIAAVLFGIAVIVLPGIAPFLLLALFAGYVLTDGVFTIMAALRARSEHHGYALLLLEGVLNLALAAMIVMWPFTAFVAFIYVVAAWALVTGAFMLVGAFGLTHQHGRWWFALGGLASMAWGVALALAPYLGAVVFSVWVAIYAIAFGVVLIALAFKLRSKHVELYVG